MGEYQIKLEAIEEYQAALHYKMVNEELCATLLGLLGQLSRYFEKNRMDIPPEVSRLMKKTSEALDARIEASRFPAALKR